MAVFSVIIFHWHLPLRRKLNERVKNPPFISFLHRSLFTIVVELCHGRKQNNDYNNYSHNHSQWGFVLFLSVKRKKQGGDTSPNLPFSIYWQLLIENPSVWQLLALWQDSQPHPSWAGRCTWLSSRSFVVYLTVAVIEPWAPDIWNSISSNFPFPQDLVFFSSPKRAWKLSEE